MKELRHREVRDLPRVTHFVNRAGIWAQAVNHSTRWLSSHPLSSDLHISSRYCSAASSITAISTLTSFSATTPWTINFILHLCLHSLLTLLQYSFRVVPWKKSMPVYSAGPRISCYNCPQPRELGKDMILGFHTSLQWGTCWNMERRPC